MQRHTRESVLQQKNRKEYTFWHQCNEKPSILSGCPVEVCLPLLGNMRIAVRATMVLTGMWHAPGRRVIGYLACSCWDSSCRRLASRDVRRLRDMFSTPSACSLLSANCCCSAADAAAPGQHRQTLSAYLCTISSPIRKLQQQHSVVTNAQRADRLVTLVPNPTRPPKAKSECCNRV